MAMSWDQGLDAASARDRQPVPMLGLTVRAQSCRFERVSHRRDPDGGKLANRVAGKGWQVAHGAGI